MPSSSSGRSFSRRRFAFWLGFGLFSLGETLRCGRLDRWAAALLQADEPSSNGDRLVEHWTRQENRTWVWFERQTQIDGDWYATAITTPPHKRTGEPYSNETGYLDERLVPESLRRSSKKSEESREEVEFDPEANQRDSAADDRPDDTPPGQPSATRKARHGRPPSRWLRHLQAEELRVWLKTIDPPEAGVEGMTYWTHLTRDHSFDPERIQGLTEDEQAKLHAAAHAGY